MGFPELFKKLLAQFISYLAFTLMGWVSWPLYIFVFLASFSALWWPNIWPKMGFPELFEKTIGSIHFIPGISPYGVSFLTLIYFHAPSLIFGPLVAKYLAENGVSGTFEKTVGSIHFMPGIYPYGVSLLTPIHFLPSLIFSPLVAKYLAENGVSGTFWKNYWLNFIPGIYPYGVSFLTLFIFMLLASFSALWWPNIWPKMGFPELFEKTIGSIHFIPGIYPYGVSLLTPIQFCVGYFWMRWVVIRAGKYCPHLWAQLVF